MLWFLGPDLLLVVKYRSHITSVYLGWFVPFFLDMKEREGKRKGEMEVEIERRQRERFVASLIHGAIC